MYHLRQALSGIRRAGFMSVACVIIMTFSLLILGIFLFATANLRELLRYAHEKVEVVAFLKDGIEQAASDSLESAIQSVPVVETVRYVSPDEALRRLKTEFGSKGYLLDAIEGNPLPASFEVTLKSRFRFKDVVENLSAQISQMPGVEDVSYGAGWIARLERLVRALAFADFGVGLVVAIAAVVTVSYTVRLTLFARREVIKVLKLVGATDFFIMAPFLLEGAIHGVVAVVLALGVIFIGYKVVALRVPQVAFMSPGMIAVFAVFGIAVAVLGSAVSLRAFITEKERS
ncbi:MAG TPA: permease-like cell division protein FtsX [bacterium]|nr:permease-like cell division protein FtsX [bacterium]